MTNSTTVAMRIKGSVRYEMRLVLNCCHGENPISCGTSEWGEACEFVELGFLIKEIGKAACQAWDNRQVSDAGVFNRFFKLANSIVTLRPRQLACQRLDIGRNLPASLMCHEN